jgi:hypothetical protein
VVFDISQIWYTRPGVASAQRPVSIANLLEAGITAQDATLSIPSHDPIK